MLTRKMQNRTDFTVAVSIMVQDQAHKGHNIPEHLKIDTHTCRNLSDDEGTL